MTGSSWVRATLLLFAAFAGACVLVVDSDALGSGECEPGYKPCPGPQQRTRCVSAADPEFGCGRDSCTPCVFEHAVSRCDRQGNCARASCLEGYADCDEDPTTGCVVDVRHDPQNCGECFRECAAPLHAIPGCANRVCAIDACEAGFGDCDRKYDNGCEEQLATNDAHCGKCDNACEDETHCVAGNCE